MYKPKAGDRVEFVGADWYYGAALTGDRGTVMEDDKGLAYVLWRDKHSIPPWSLCRRIDEEIVMPKVGDRAEVASPTEQWLDACKDFYGRVYSHCTSANIDSLAHELHRKHVELFPPPETKDPVCPKCGCGETTVWYCDGKRLNPEALCFKRARGDEHMHRFCANCDYEWLEPCLDAK